MDKELEKEIINCSRCGLCMDVCPVYKAKKTETSVLRGKFLQLLGLIRGDLKPDEKIRYNLDLCLSCAKCVKACPSGSNAVEIFSKVKSSNLTFFEKLFYSAPAFKLKMLSLKILYAIKYPIGKKRKKAEIQFGSEKIAHFKGCATKITKTGLNSILKDGKFSCCALPFYVKGRLDLYEKYKKRNLKLFEKYDKIVFDCATCFNAVSSYKEVDKSKLIYFTDFYKGLNLKSKEKVKIAFHKPCHLSDEKFDEIKEILKGIENVVLLEFEGEKDCCGFGGDFFTRHIKTAAYLSTEKIKNVINSGADVVLTTCPTCLWSLKFGIKTLGVKNLKAFDLADFLSEVME